LRVGTIAGTDAADPVKDAFQAGDLDHVVCTIAKGGTGLTLTRSSNPLFVEEDWVPAINDQATDRTHRIGQTEPVTPRILRCPNTVDTKKIVPKLDFKRRVGEAVLGA
jgi:non-specific serine/threonine protein kinase